MDIKFTVFATGPTIIGNYLIYRAAETTALGTIVASAVDPPPQTFPRNVFLAGVRPVPHLVQVYSSVDGVSLDTLLSDFLYDPSFSNVEIRPTLFLVTNRGLPYDPVDGDTFIGPIDGSVPGYEEIASWGDWWVEVRSKGGKIIEGAEYTKNGSNDGFTYPEAFYSDVIAICFPPKITTVSPIVNVQDLFAGYIKVTGTATMTADWLGHYVDLEFTGNSGSITLLPVADVPENKQLMLFNMVGNQQQVTIKAAAGESIRWFDGNYPELYIGKTENLVLFKRTDTSDPLNPVAHWHVANQLEGMAKAGTSVPTQTGVLQPTIHPNQGVFDGQPIDLAVWPRVRWFVKRLPPAIVLPLASRNAGNVGFWFYDGADLDSAANIYPPDVLGRHARNIPGDRGNDSGRDATSNAGTLDSSHNKQHTHTYTKPKLRSNSDAAGVADYVDIEVTQTGPDPDARPGEATVLSYGVVPSFWL